MEKLRKFIEIEKKDIAEMRDEGINKFNTDIDAWERTILIIEAELNEATKDSNPACEHIYGLRINKDRKLVDVNVKPIDNDIFIWMRQFKYCPKCGLRL